MRCRHLCVAFPVGLLVGLALARPAGAVAPEIKDEGKFFGAEAVKKANDEIRTIARKHNKDLLIETFMTPPGQPAEKVKAMSPEERNRFFQKLAAERAAAAVVNGVYVFVCREPAHIRVEVTSQARPALG